MEKYGRQGIIKATKGNGDRLAALLLEAAQTVSGLSGCILYVVGRDTSDADVICVTEIWETKEDHANALKQDTVRAVIAKAMPMVDTSAMSGNEFRTIGGKGI